MLILRETGEFKVVLFQYLAFCMCNGPCSAEEGEQVVKSLNIGTRLNYVYVDIYASSSSLLSV